MHSSESVEWYTPARYIEAAREVMGGIDLDPASCALANQTVQAARYYAVRDNALAQPWGGRIWMNPPYGGWQGKFIRRAVAAYESGEIEAAIVLVNAYATERGWFAPLWAYPLCFAYHRIAFYNEAGTGDQNNHASVFGYLGRDLERFAAVFGRIGNVVVRVAGGAA